MARTNNIIAITLLTLFLACSKYDNKKISGWIYEWHDNGKIYKQSFFYNGKLEGLVSIWSSEGKLSYELFYKNDSLKWEKEYLFPDRITTEYYLSDSIVMKASFLLIPSYISEYKNNCENGKWTEWYSNGKKKNEGFYKYIHNFTPYSFTDDSVSGFILSSEYRRSPKDRLWKYWSEKGILVKEEFWEKGVLKETKEYNEEGNLIK